MGSGCIMTIPEEQSGDATVHKIFIDLGKTEFDYLNNHPQSSDKIKCIFTGYFGDKAHQCYGKVCIHGASSREYPKKSLRIHFEEELACDNIFFRFPPVKSSRNKFKQLILNANAIDFSNIRNFLSLYISTKLGVFTPRVDFAEVYINGTYYGLYSIIENIHKELFQNVMGHNHFDLLKSYYHNGNFKTYNIYPGDPFVKPEEGFELKHGTPEKLRNFVYWLESDSSTVQELTTFISMKSFTRYVWRCYYTSDFDALSKNFFFLYNKMCDTFCIIPWDADATFGRRWNGEQKPSVPFKYYVSRNGIGDYLIKNDSLKATFLKELDEIDTIINPAQLKRLLATLQEELSDAVYKDMNRWNNVLIDYFKTRGWTHWNNQIASNPKDMWHSEINLIKEFIDRRKQEILLDLTHNAE